MPLPTEGEPLASHSEADEVLHAADGRRQRAAQLVAVRLQEAHLLQPAAAAQLARHRAAQRVVAQEQHLHQQASKQASNVTACM